MSESLLQCLSVCPSVCLSVRMSVHKVISIPFVRALMRNLKNQSINSHLLPQYISYTSSCYSIDLIHERLLYSCDHSVL